MTSRGLRDQKRELARTHLVAIDTAAQQLLQHYTRINITRTSCPDASVANMYEVCTCKLRTRRHHMRHEAPPVRKEHNPKTNCSQCCTILHATRPSLAPTTFRRIYTEVQQKLGAIIPGVVRQCCHSQHFCCWGDARNMVVVD